MDQPSASSTFQFAGHLHTLSWHLFFFKSYFLVFFLAMLGLRCCAQAFSSCGEQGLLFVVVYTFPLVWLLCCRAGALGSRLRSSAAWA